MSARELVLVREVPTRDRVVVTRSAPLRLTRRGRAVVRVLVVAGLLVGVLAGILLAQRAAFAAPVLPEAPAPVHEYVVMPGDTLWTIAGEVAPHADPRETVRRLQDVNALTSVILQPGQLLRVP